MTKMTPMTGLLLAGTACFMVSTAAAAKPIAAPDCMKVYTCQASCVAWEPTCLETCGASASADAVAQADLLVGCVRQNCPLSDPTSLFEGCPWDACSQQVMDCQGSYTCNITGGSCPAGTACGLMVDLVTQCVPSDGIGEGEACDPQQTETLPCADGLFCIQVTQPDDGQCMRFCTADFECNGKPCAMPVFEGVDGIGICFCNDGDGDLACDAVDCAPADPDVHPGAQEVCDGTDNNCNGQTDEGCEPNPDAGEGTVESVEAVEVAEPFDAQSQPDMAQFDASLPDIAAMDAAQESSGQSDLHGKEDQSATQDLSPDGSSIPTPDLVAADTTTGTGKKDGGCGAAGGSAQLPTGMLILAALLALASLPGRRRNSIS